MHYSIIFILLAKAIFGLVSIKTFIGYAGTEVGAEAGTITAVTIDDRQQSIYWAGLY